VPVSVTGAGVVVRLATDEETRSVESMRRGRDFILDPPRSSVCAVPAGPLGDDEVYVVSQAFVEFIHDGEALRWTAYEHHGNAVPVSRDATLELLRVVDETCGTLIDLLADMRHAGLRVSRWEVLTAPRRVELAPELERRLAPLRRG
jgi:hypothetical protein